MQYYPTYIRLRGSPYGTVQNQEHSATPPYLVATFRSSGVATFRSTYQLFIMGPPNLISPNLYCPKLTSHNSILFWPNYLFAKRFMWPKAHFA